ncbi:MAG: hypothetical protein A3G80_09520 [Betaproteobacteria bacterium RIFCSPLOWO2_12_FULL_62_13b]|nr:MAG: hypothetical protein A3G80_09520 [Betaproteobacteria bacterium RIFCSPLOWO2_12_FULL_62_13b]
MRFSKFAAWLLAGVVSLAGTAALAQEKPSKAAQAQAAEAAPVFTDNAICLGCHGNKGFAAPGPDGKPRALDVAAEKFEQSVHGKRLCVECHKNIDEIPHKKGLEIKVSCVQCHEALWEEAKKATGNGRTTRLGVVVEQIERYMRSVHARPSREDQSRTNATCYNCHDAHYVYPKGSPIRAEWRLNIPNACGQCHVEERKEYVGSVHGREVMEKKNPKAAICSDCHTTHDVADPALAATKLVIGANCGNCHKENKKTYTDTYHGQVNTLGYAYTAKCFDCHGNHGIQRVSDSRSKVHPDNRLGTCQGCHKDATPGFATFQPHANTHDFDRFPYMWITSKFMILLLAGVFAFFWTHSALWFYREYKDRQARKNRPHVRTDELPKANGRYVRRWSGAWRLSHLVFALATAPGQPPRHLPGLSQGRDPGLRDLPAARQYP